MSRIFKKQDLLIEKLLTESTVTAAAAAAGVNRRTVTRWMNDAMFKARLRQARDEALSRALGRIEFAANEGADVLIAALRGEQVSGVRFRAAKAIFEIAALAREQEFSDRLDLIEQQLAERPDEP